LLKEQEAEYMLNSMMKNGKAYQDLEIIKPLFKKSLATLKVLMSDTCIGHLFDRVALTFCQVNTINTMKILLRVRQMFFAWNLMH